MNKCGDCKFFVKNGKCGFYQMVKGAINLPFGQAPFWVWSDCYSDREQVRSDVQSNCVVFFDRNNPPNAPDQGSVLR